MGSRYKKFESLYVMGVVLMAYFCAFIIPGDLLILGTPLAKWFFLGYVCVVYILDIWINRISVTEIIILLLIVLHFFVFSSTQLLMLICYLLLFRINKRGYGEYILKIIYRFRLNYVALIMTIFYSVLYNSEGRSVFTAIKEVNQSGLLILCIGLMERKYNKFLGNSLLLLGLFTYSRNYYLSLVAFGVLNMGFIKAIFEKYNLCARLSFVNIIIFSSLILFILGMLFQQLYIDGRIFYSGSGFGRIFAIFDLSNYYRFTANSYIIDVMRRIPQYLLTGIDDLNVYFTLERNIAVEKGYRFTPTTPHNFFFSYLRIYGAWVLVFVWLINKIMKDVVNRNNFCVFFAIMLYAIFLSAGFNMYYLYITYFVLISYANEN